MKEKNNNDKNTEQRKKWKRKIKLRVQGFETAPNIPNEQRRVGLPK